MSESQTGSLPCLCQGAHSPVIIIMGIGVNTVDPFVIKSLVQYMLGLAGLIVAALSFSIQLRLSCAYCLSSSTSFFTKLPFSSPSLLQALQDS